MGDLHLWAILTNKENGTEVDQSLVRGIPTGTKLKVTNVSVGQSHSVFEAKGYPLSFNTVQFDFVDDDGKAVDIFIDRRFNQYLGW